jgi:hypothetical protein
MLRKSVTFQPSRQPQWQILMNKPFPVPQIEQQKDDAIRGLSNYMFFEAQRMAKEELGPDKFDG